MTNLSELEALAKAASANDWSFWQNLAVAVPTEQYPDGDFIAAASPQKILQMIALIRTMRKSFDAWPHHFMSVKAIEAYEEFENDKSIRT